MADRNGSNSTPDPFDVRIARLASSQYGIVSREQVLRVGGSQRVVQRRVAMGRWERIDVDVFRVAGSPRSWQQSVLAACFACGPDAMVSHRAASALWMLPGCDLAPPEVVIPWTQHRRSPGGVIVHRSRTLLHSDRVVVRRIPVTSVARTLMDLASVVSLDIVEEALDDALRRGLVSVGRLQWRLKELGGNGNVGAGSLRSLVASRDLSSAIPDSVFETRLLRVLRSSHLPEVVRQHRVPDGRGGVAVIDFAYPTERVAIEADSYRWHGGRAKWERDLARRNVLTSLGWRVIHVTWAELTRNPDEMIRRIEMALTEARAELSLN
jgi:very-short-patch-repair endonuclease